MDEIKAEKILKEQDPPHTKTVRFKSSIGDTLSMKEDTDASSLPDTISSVTQHEAFIQTAVLETASVSSIKTKDVKMEVPDQLNEENTLPDDTSPNIVMESNEEMSDHAVTEISLTDFHKFESGISVYDVELPSVRPRAQQQETTISSTIHEADMERVGVPVEEIIGDATAETMAEHTIPLTSETYISSIKNQELIEAQMETVKDEISIFSKEYAISKEDLKQAEADIKNVVIQGEITENFKEAEIQEYEGSFELPKFKLLSFGITSLQVLKDADTQKKGIEEQKKISPSSGNNVKKELDVEMSSPDIEMTFQKSVDIEVKVANSKKKSTKNKRSTFEKVVTKERSREVLISLSKAGDVALAKTEDLKDVDVQDSEKYTEEKPVIDEVKTEKILLKQDTSNIKTKKFELSLCDALAMEEDTGGASILDSISSATQHEASILDHISETARISSIFIKDVQVEAKDQMNDGNVPADTKLTDISVKGKADVYNLPTAEVSFHDFDKSDNEISICDAELTEIRPSDQEPETAIYSPKEKAKSEHLGMIIQETIVADTSETFSEPTKTLKLESHIPSLKTEEPDICRIVTPKDEIRTSSNDIKISKEVLKEFDTKLENVEFSGEVTESSRETEILEFDGAVNLHKLKLHSFRITSSQVDEDAENLKESKDEHKEIQPTSNVNKENEFQFSSPDIETNVEKYVDIEVKAAKCKKKSTKFKRSTFEKVVTKERTREVLMSLSKEDDGALAKTEELKDVTVQDSEKEAEEKIVIDEVKAEVILKEPDTSDIKTVGIELSIEHSLAMKEDVDHASIPDTSSSATQHEPCIQDYISEPARISSIKLKDVQKKVKDQMTDGNVPADTTLTDVSVQGKAHLGNLSTTEVSFYDSDKSENGISIRDAELTEIRPSEQEPEASIYIQKEKSESEVLGMLIEETIGADTSETISEPTKTLKLQSHIPSLKTEELNISQIETPKDEIRTSSIDIKISKDVLNEDDTNIENVDFPGEVTDSSRDTEILEYDGSVKLHKFKLQSFGITSLQVVEGAENPKEIKEEQKEIQPTPDDDVNKEIDFQLSSPDIKTAVEKYVDIAVKAAKLTFEEKLSEIRPFDQKPKTPNLILKKKSEIESISVPIEERSVNETSRKIVEQVETLTSRTDIPVIARGEMNKYEKQTWIDELNVSYLQIIKSEEDNKGFISEYKDVALTEECVDASKDQEARDTEDSIKFNECILMSSALTAKQVVNKSDCHKESREAKKVISASLTDGIDHKFRIYELQSPDTVFFMEIPADTEINTTKVKRKITKIKLSSSDNTGSEEQSPEDILSFPIGKEYSVLCKSEDEKNKKGGGHEFGDAADINSPCDNISSNMNVTKLKTFAFEIKTSREQILGDTLQPGETLEISSPENKDAATLSDGKGMQEARGDISGSHKYPIKFQLQAPNIDVSTSVDDVKQEPNTTIEDTPPQKTERQTELDTKPPKHTGWFSFPKIGFSSWKRDKSTDKD